MSGGVGTAIGVRDLSPCHGVPTGRHGRRRGLFDELGKHPQQFQVTRLGTEPSGLPQAHGKVFGRWLVFPGKVVPTYGSAEVVEEIRLFGRPEVRLSVDAGGADVQDLGDSRHHGRGSGPQTDFDLAQIRQGDSGLAGQPGLSEAPRFTQDGNVLAGGGRALHDITLPRPEPFVASTGGREAAVVQAVC